MWLEAHLIHFLGIPIVDLLRFIPNINRGQEYYGR